MTFLADGFLGTRGTFFSDLLIVTVVLLFPLFTTGYFLARTHRGSAHRLVMLTLYSMVVVYVLIYLVHVVDDRLILKFRDPSSPVYLVYWVLGVIHSAFAVGALVFGWQTVGLGRRLAKIGPRGYYLPASDRPIHARRGKIALVCFAATTVTGIGVYYLLFVW